MVTLTDIAPCFRTSLTVEVDNCHRLHDLGAAEAPALEIVLLEEIDSGFADALLCGLVRHFFRLTVADFLAAFLICLGGEGQLE